MTRFWAKSLVLTTLFFSLSSFAKTPEAPTESDWQKAFGKFDTPQIYFQNDDALQARLRILDYAPAGTEVAILAFVFENGKTTRRLAAHVCAAEARGVNVRWITDAKSGSIAGEPNVFDHPVNEEIFQYMANCGAEVRIHNHFSAFTKIAGRIVPAAKYLQKIDQLAQATLNKINHRKLFWAKTPQGQACFILGGRNLGDHYFVNVEDYEAFFDSDILICNHFEGHGNLDPVVEQTLASFDSLWNDDINGANGDIEKEDDPVEIYKVPVQENFNFEKIYLADSSSKNQSLNIKTNKTEKEGKIPQAIAKNDAVPTGLELRNAYDWELKTAIWNPALDRARQTLHDMVRREQAEIFIESAYMDFDPKLKELLKEALERGVRVTILSNSFYTSDGGSKLIPLTRAGFIGDLRLGYSDNFTMDFGDYASNSRQNMQEPGQKGRFEFYVTTPYAGHMTHFKGAGFKCQKADDGSFYKSFLLGSHNFHQRSGLSDKEHALIWKEPVDLTCFNRHYSYQLDTNGNMIDGDAIKARALKETGMDYDEIVQRHEKLEGGGYGLLSQDNRDLIEHRMNYWSELNQGFLEENRPLLLAFPNLRSEIDSVYEQSANPGLAKKALKWMKDRSYENYDPAQISELKPGPKKILNMLSPIRDFVSSFL